jgi:hypothetical protein
MASICHMLVGAICTGGYKLELIVVGLGVTSAVKRLSETEKFMAV